MFKLPYLSYSFSGDTVMFIIYAPDRNTHLTRTFDNWICQSAPVINVWRLDFQASPARQPKEGAKRPLEYRLKQLLLIIFDNQTDNPRRLRGEIEEFS